MESNTQNAVPYNEALRKINNSLENALNTFGRSSRQYHAVLEILKNCLLDIEREKQKQTVDPDMLSTAMGFLQLGE
ncbi:hypothetical protein N7474_007682 [Penicillium riverlandense]|uniref:uncharacterized protein n=1 Tax=Penicillium riverlandense TaxID=1903569 RepID=UPI0025477C02|nr:uncharacterized protein N7474_007682 [Penicillium riverlandense]KAJ5811381.1 hypothetical protein N7474_007682 [Penicillium riverlandense]